MSFRDKFRKLGSSTKSRLSGTKPGNTSTNAGPGQSPSAPIVKSGTPSRWSHLRMFVSALEQATQPLPPLKAVISELAESLGIHDNMLRGQREYEQLHSELEDLFETLQKHCLGNIPAVITTTVEAPRKSIKHEMDDLKQNTEKYKMGKYVGAEQNFEATMACYRRTHCHLQRISLNMDISVWRIVDGVATDSRLDRLSPSLSACYNSAQATELKRRPCTKDTRVDLLAQVFDWVGNSVPGSLYWISGMAGTGKTTIAYSICREMDANQQLVASFFCSRVLPECRNVSLIIPSIAYQIARASRPFRSVLSAVLEKDPDVHTRLPHLQFNSLIAVPLLEVKDSVADNFVVVIDALDECDNREATGQILDILLTKTLNLPVKFIVASRPEPEIRDEMQKQNDQAGSRVVLHELDGHAVRIDIETYLKAGLAPMKPTDEQISQLVERTGVLFIYAATVVRYVGNDRFRRSEERLQKVLEPSTKSENKHAEIDELYTTILRVALENPSLDSEEREDVRQVLHTVICAQDPLTIEALSGLTGLHPDLI